MLIIMLIAGVVIIFVAVVAMRPSEFRVTRSTSIGAPVGVVFTQVNDLHKWEAWSPWAKMDPTAKSTFEGPPSGKDASMSWSGNNKIGEGKMTITDSRPIQLVRFRLEFVRPFKGTNTAEFSFIPRGNQTLVEWSMSGKNNFFSKAFGLFVDCDKMLGTQFEQGLANMKSVAESAPQNSGLGVGN